MYAIEIDQLTKGFGSVPILHGLTLQVQEGEIYGLLGPSGSGKTTLLSVLLGFIKPDRGMVRVLGERNLERARGYVGYMPGLARYHLRFTAQEYLFFLGQLSDIAGSHLTQRIKQNLALVGLSSVAKHKLYTYTKGMLQRFGLAQALLAQPRILLLDEPTSGLEPSSRYEILDILAKIQAQEGITILICTHHLDVIETLCDRVGILAHGKLATQVVVDDIRDIGTSVTIHVNGLSRELQTALSNLSNAVYCNEHIITLRPNSYPLQQEVNRLLLEAEIPILSLESLERPIEHLYLKAVHSASTAYPTGYSSLETSGVPQYPPQTPSPSLDQDQNQQDLFLKELLDRDDQQNHSLQTETDHDSHDNSQHRSVEETGEQDGTRTL